MKPLSSLYIHFPYCLNACNYCDFFKFTFDPKPNQGLLPFHNYLKTSVATHNKLMSENQYTWNPLNTLYIGGGTPSLWGSSGAYFFKNFLENLFPDNIPVFSNNYEFTLEVNPATFHIKDFESWERIGVNRYSIGVQSLNPTFIEILGRAHSLQQTIETLEYFAPRNINFSVDFMLGLPKSSEYGRNIIRELSDILKYNPSHISLYILTPKKDYLYSTSLPDEDYVSQEYLEVVKFLNKNQFHHYEVSNFAKKDKESKHNLEYWKSAPVAAFGPSATGLLVNDKNKGALRYKWNSNFSDLMNIEKLSKEELKLEKLYMLLRTNIGINPAEFFSQNNFDKFMTLVADWDQEDLVDIFSSKRVVLSSKGFLILDTLINDIFRATDL